MIPIKFHGLGTWPGESSKVRRHSPFRAGYQSTLDMLDRELRALAAKNVQILVDVEPRWIRQDGWLRSDARARSPGVVLTFDSKHGPLSYPCDTYTDWHDNLRAIAMALECLRAVDRYGVTRRGEQYTGWFALPEPGGGSAPRPRPAAQTFTADQAVHWIWLHTADGAAGVNEGNALKALRDRECFLALYRAAAKALHPDAGGSTDDFKTLQDMKAIVEKTYEARGL